MTESSTEIIKILSHDVKFTKSSPGIWAEGGMGRAAIKYGEILIDPEQAPDSLKSTIIHEVTHYISDLLSLDLSEQQVDGISIGMFTFLNDNPKLVNREFYNKKN